MTSSGKAPPVYILPKFRLQTQRVIRWLQEKAGKTSNTSINISSLPCLLFHLARVGKDIPGCVYVPSENLAEVQLDRDVFLYTVGMACAWHQEHDETVHCSAALVRRWAFILCHICCPRHDLELLPGRHKPSPKTTSSYSRFCRISYVQFRHMFLPGARAVDQRYLSALAGERGEEGRVPPPRCGFPTTGDTQTQMLIC